MGVGGLLRKWDHGREQLEEEGLVGAGKPAAAKADGDWQLSEAFCDFSSPGWAISRGTWPVVLGSGPGTWAAAECHGEKPQPENNRDQASRAGTGCEF